MCSRVTNPAGQQIQTRVFIESQTGVRFGGFARAEGFQQTWGRRLLALKTVPVAGFSERGRRPSQGTVDFDADGLLVVAIVRARDGGRESRVVTQAAGATVAPVHDRMPVLLRGRDEDVERALVRLAGRRAA